MIFTTETRRKPNSFLRPFLRPASYLGCHVEISLHACVVARGDRATKLASNFSFKHGGPQSTKFSNRPVGWGASTVTRRFSLAAAGVTNTWAGLVRNAGLLPSTRWPSQARAKAGRDEQHRDDPMPPNHGRRREARGDGNPMQGAVDRMVMGTVVIRLHPIFPRLEGNPKRYILRSAWGNDRDPRNTISWGGRLLFQESFPGYTLLIIGVLGSRIPLDNLRRVLPLSWGRSALPRWLSDSGQSNG